MTRQAAIIVVMGVAGSGKTRIGRAVAHALGWRFIEGDDYHPPENVARMAAGQPLDDAAREPWLSALRAELLACRAANTPAVLASSALKARYRERLRVDDSVRFVYLRGNYALIAKRLKRRRGHFFNPALLRSQFAALEDPDDALVIDAADNADAIVRRIVAWASG